MWLSVPVASYLMVVAATGLASDEAASSGPSAPNSERIRVTEATGEVAIEGDPIAVRDAAKDDALRKCVQQVATTIVTAATETDQKRLLSDRVYAQSEGYVRKFTILREYQERNAYLMQLRCEVSESKLDEDLMAFGIAYRRAGMPRIAVLIAEQSFNATKATGWWQGGGNTADLRVVENAFISRMEKSGFTFVDPEILAGKVRLEVVGADPNNQQAREIGIKTGAEIVVVGRAFAKPLGEIGTNGTTLFSSIGNISARAVRVDNGEVIAATEFTADAGSGFEQSTAGRFALSNAGRKLASELFARIGKVWTSEQNGTMHVALRVSGVEDYSILQTFRAALLAKVHGVKSADLRNMDGGRAELDVAVAGNPQTMAEDLTVKEFAHYTVRVVKVTPNTLEVELGRPERGAGRP